MAAEAVRAPDLPAAWRAALRFCPYCSGLGVDGGRDCVRCEGSGDLLDAMLRGAYRRGREDALVQMRQVYAVARLAGEQVRDAPVPELRRAVGL